MQYLNRTKDRDIPNLYSISIEWDCRNFVVALQGGKDFEQRLNEVIKSYYDQELEFGTLQNSEGSKEYENIFQCKGTSGDVIYIESIEIW